MNRQLIENKYREVSNLSFKAASLALDNCDEALINELTFGVLGMDLSINNGRYPLYLKQKEKFHHTYTNYCIDEELKSKIHNLLKDICDYEASLDPDFEVLKRENFFHRMITKSFKEKDVNSLKKYLHETYWSKF